MDHGGDEDAFEYDRAPLPGIELRQSEVVAGERRVDDVAGTSERTEGGDAVAGTECGEAEAELGELDGLCDVQQVRGGGGDGHR